jgi:hypothetical protein
VLGHFVRAAACAHGAFCESSSMCAWGPVWSVQAVQSRALARRQRRDAAELLRRVGERNAAIHMRNNRRAERRAAVAVAVEKARELRGKRR